MNRVLKSFIIKVFLQHGRIRVFTIEFLLLRCFEPEINHETVKLKEVRSEEYIFNEQIGYSMAFRLLFPFLRISTNNLLRTSTRIR